jgi:hypothetical protein
MPGMNAQLLTDSEATAVRIREALDATLGAAEPGPRREQSDAHVPLLALRLATDLAQDFLD